MLSYEDARALVFEHVKTLEKVTRPLTESQGHALSEDILAPHGMPLFDNSAVDGYAVQAEDLAESSSENPVRLKKLGYISAGDTGEERLGSGQCMQIATGAPVPPGADTIVMKEDIELEDANVCFTQAIRKTENVRYQGEDIPEGRTMIPAGTVIGPAQIAVLASFGFAQVPVHRLPKVSIVSTGSELVDVDVEPQAGQIRESNRYMLAGMVQQETCELVKVSMIPDIPEILKADFEEALQADIALVSGGMSVGDKDFAKPLLKEMGVEEIFWKIKFKPGKPLFFGKRGKTLVFGLPGNPASSYVLFEEFVRPALRKMMGRRVLEEALVKATLDVAITKTHKRLHFMRGQLSEKNGEFRARPLGFQGSHSIGSLVESNALIRVEADSPELPAGSQVLVRPLKNEIA
ncbi:MAG: molybdopterin molybdotransferase MoeA [SAR324 cluster bacterium]|nr:molybdopterin molybdotransferase MoeA [SAR324 cluster bacterium]MBL7036020.1 molybdopterin molybdotransferase MoeA [SAR324 cluster bacterium]